MRPKRIQKAKEKAKKEKEKVKKAKEKEKEKEKEREAKAVARAQKAQQKQEEELKLLKYHAVAPKVVPAAQLRPSPPLDVHAWQGNVRMLKKHQKDAICSTLSSRQRGHIYYFGMGSGKTLTAITAAQQYGSAVIIVPATLRPEWQKEIKKWKANPKSFQVMSYQEFYRHPVDLTGQFVIVDEAHALRSSGSKMARVIFHELRKAHKVALLTGTPLYNRPTDISVLLNPVSSQRLPTLDETYEKEFGKHPDAFAKLVRDNVVYYKPGVDPDNYPHVIEKTVPLVATPAQQKVYAALEEKNLDELAKLDHLLAAKLELMSARDQVALGSLMKKLQSFSVQARQIANRDPRGPMHVPKIQYIINYIRKHPKHRILVFSHFLASGLQQVAKELQDHGIKYEVYTGEQKLKERGQLVENYNRGKINVLLLSSAGGEGLDLKRTDAVFIVEPHWNWAKIGQSIGRAARFQSHPPHSTVRVFKFVTTFPNAKLKGIEKAMVKIADDKQRRIDLQNKHIIEQSQRVVDLRARKCALRGPLAPQYLSKKRSR